MAATEQLFNTRERKRFERHDIWERIAENGTISAAVMVIAAIAAVICANTDAYEEKGSASRLEKMLLCLRRF